ncbi:MAG: hypothetical protein CME64_14560 [Halobacteriovoraceae bacterium]|nr:hypothetical protein [Halobacteriovoraceae bacterium]|tara:strand:- start:112781 stop:113869 length:1089 start_codon:yes stop_codon:yes gene_type:complete
MAKNSINFLIDHIDPLGQGVFKKHDQIYFIPKTLPGERGQAEIIKSKKNIHFCRLVKIEDSSSCRIDPICPHFTECPGCHFLHTTYEDELKFKAESFKRMLAPIGSPEFDVIEAPERTGYRNRVQLHYHKRSQSLGFIKALQNRILEVPECKIFKSDLKPSFDELYRNKSKYLKKSKRPKGHVELYHRGDDEIKVSWDTRYASDGFTQVNEQMNKKLLECVSNALKDQHPKSTLDLFGGDGNLSRSIDGETFHIDMYPFERKDNFISLDLSEEESLAQFSTVVGNQEFDLFIVDPPRAGFKHLNAWVKKFAPKTLLYVSCHPQTMIRDIRQLEMPYKILETKLLDLFPSTFHFEAMTVIRFK